MSKSITFGQVRSIPKDVEETRTIPFVLSTSTRDRHRTILNQANWKFDNYRKNPVVGYMHNMFGNMCNPPDPDDVIGQDRGVNVENIAGALSLIGFPCFEPASVNLKAEKIFRKIILGSLRAVSVGFIEIGKGAWGTGQEAEGRENETYRFAGQELIEYSIVNVPSNPDGVKRAMRDQTTAALTYIRGALGGKFRLSQIENMRVCDVLDLLDGNDLEIRESDPDKVRAMLHEKSANRDINALIEKQRKDFKYLKEKIIFENQKDDFHKLILESYRLRN